MKHYNKSIREYDRRINLNNHFLFIHIPKNAGTSILKTLGLTSSTHIKANQIYKSPSRRLLKERFSFSIVRDPISRFISLYNYARLDISFYHNNLEPQKALYGVHLDYTLLKNANINECVNYLVQGKLKHDNSWNHWEPQYTWVCNENEQLLIKKFYKIENTMALKMEFSKFFKREIDFPRLNPSTTPITARKLYNELSQDSLNTLFEYYKKDFEIFNY